MMLRCFLVYLGTLVSLGVVGQTSEFGTLLEVTAPNSVILKLSQQRLVKLTLLGPDFGEMEDQSCASSQRAAKLCRILEKELKRQSLGIIYEQWQDDALLGDIVVDGHLMSEKLVRDGHYRFDTSYTRAAYLIDAEKDARCHYRGIWRHLLGDFRVAHQCQQL